MQNNYTLLINPLSYRQNLLLFIATLLGLAGLQWLGIQQYYSVSTAAIITDALTSWLLLGLFVFFIANTFSYYHPSRGIAVIIIVVPLILMAIWYQLSYWLLGLMIGDEEYQLLLASSRIYRATVAFLILCSTTVFSLMWYRLGEKADEKERNQETQRLAKEAELFKLRQQLQPHFLFNSLNSINSLIGSRPAEARTMIQQLSDFFRGTLKREQTQFVPLSEELDYLNIYLKIEQLRFGHRMKVQMEVSEELQQWRMPPLLLQPILENAIKFGLYGTTDEIIIELHAEQKENLLFVRVSNPYDKDMLPPKGTGFGLTSIKRRLFLLFARQDLLETKDENGKFHVLLKIPKTHD